MDSETTCEFQRINLEDNFSFDYQKITYNNFGEETVFPIYRAKVINAKIGDDILFEITKFGDLFQTNRREEKPITAIRKITKTLKTYVENLIGSSEIVAIPISYINLPIYANLDSVYRVLEEKYEKQNFTRKMTKNKDCR